MSLRKVLAGIGALCATALLSSPAYAVLTIEIRVGGVLEETVVDNGALDTNPAVDIINFAEAGLGIPGYDVVGEIARSNANGNPPGPIALLTNNIEIVRTGSGALLIEFLVSATGYPFPGGNATKNLLSGLTNLPGGIVPNAGDTTEFQSWADPDNVLFAIAGEPTPGAQPLPANALGTSDASTQFDDPALPFSLTNRIRVSLSRNNSSVQVTGNTSVTPTPEPGSIALLAMGGASLFGYGWRRRKAQAV